MFTSKFLAALLFATSFTLVAQNEADAHLRTALKFADLYNSADAAPHFAEAERLSIAEGNQPKALHARLGRIRATVEQERRNLPAVSLEIEEELATNPLLQSRQDLRMFAWIVKGDVESEAN